VPFPIKKGAVQDNKRLRRGKGSPGKVSRSNLKGGGGPASSPSPHPRPATDEVIDVCLKFKEKKKKGSEKGRGLGSPARFKKKDLSRPTKTENPFHDKKFAAVFECC